MHGFNRRVLRSETFFNVAFNRFDDNDGIVHNQAYGEYETKKGQRVNGETASIGINVARQPCKKM